MELTRKEEVARDRIVAKLAKAQERYETSLAERDALIGQAITMPGMSIRAIATAIDKSPASVEYRLKVIRRGEQ